jgi:uncharacterized protein YjiS (DUF1127 family)
MRSMTWIESDRKSKRSDGVMRAVLRGVAESFRRAQQRRDLAALSDHALRDIGLSRREVELEIDKPFWRA